MSVGPTVPGAELPGTGGPSVHEPTAYRAPEGSTHIYLVRHGRPVPYRPDELRPHYEGHDDPPLSEAGLCQAELVAKRLAPLEIGAIYSSPLRRARETALPLVATTGVLLVTLPDLREVYLGQWEGGVVHMRLGQHDPLWDEVRSSQRWDAIPEAEPNESLHERAARALDAIIARSAGQRVAVFAHDGIIAAALSITTGATPFAFSSSEHASVSLVVAEKDSWRLRIFNDTCHL